MTVIVGWMLYSGYAELGVCCTWCTLNLVYTGHGVWCTLHILYSVYTVLGDDSGWLHRVIERDDIASCPHEMVVLRTRERNGS